MSIFWCVVLVVVLINYFHSIAYLLERMNWNYVKENKKITLLSKVIFPSLAIITESNSIGFIFKLRLFFSNEADFGESKSFPEFWKSDDNDGLSWLAKIVLKVVITVIFYFLIIVEWFYVVLWQFLIKWVIWECWIKTIIWEIMIKGFIWGILLSGNWLNKLK